MTELLLPRRYNISAVCHCNKEGKLMELISIANILDEKNQLIKISLKFVCKHGNQFSINIDNF